MDALENAGRLSASVYRDCTLYTTLSPCPMCSGAIVLYGIPRVVIGEHVTFMGDESWLRSHGVELTLADNAECKALMTAFIEAQPTLWNEDIGELPELLSLSSAGRRVGKEWGRTGRSRGSPYHKK